tara:strand:+ start:2119 stop:2292 length:174 start_codon:yes stop_codon:yes gene_type:complete
MNPELLEEMTELEALQYALETLQDLDEHCNNDEQRAELSEVVGVLACIRDEYQDDDE